MTHRFKVLGSALLAVCALGAVIASAASAHKFVGGPADKTGTGSNGITGVKSGSLEVKCATETISATNVPNGAESVLFTPSASGCTAAPFGASPVHMNGCGYQLGGNTTTSPTTTTGTKTDASFSIICPAGASITKTAPGCTIHIDGSGHSPPRNQGLHGVTYHNEGFGTTADIKVTLTVDNLHYTTAGGFICSLGGLSTTGNDGFITSSHTVKGYTANSAHTTGHHRAIKFE